MCTGICRTPFTTLQSTPAIRTAVLLNCGVWAQKMLFRVGAAAEGSESTWAWGMLVVKQRVMKCLGLLWFSLRFHRSINIQTHTFLKAIQISEGKIPSRAHKYPLNIRVSADCWPPWGQSWALGVPAPLPMGSSPPAQGQGPLQCPHGTAWQVSSVLQIFWYRCLQQSAQTEYNSFWHSHVCGRNLLL